MGDAGRGGDGGREEGAKGELKAEKVYQERRDGRPSLTQEEGGVRRRRNAPMMVRRRGGSEASGLTSRASHLAPGTSRSMKLLPLHSSAAAMHKPIIM